MAEYCSRGLRENLKCNERLRLHVNHQTNVCGELVFIY
jgi:hypothetical protein